MNDFALPPIDHSTIPYANRATHAPVPLDHPDLTDDEIRMCGGVTWVTLAIGLILFLFLLVGLIHQIRHIFAR